MANVKVTADDGGFLFLQVIAVGLEALIPFLDSVLKSIQLLTGVGDVGCDEVEFLEFNGDHPSLLAVFLVKGQVLNH